MTPNVLSERRRRRQMPVGLSPAVAPTMKSKSAAISTSYPNLSTFRFPTKAAKTAGYLPNERPLISSANLQFKLCFRPYIELNDSVMRLGVCQVHFKKLRTTTTFFEKVYIIIVTAQFFRQGNSAAGKNFTAVNRMYSIYPIEGHSPDRSAGYWPQVNSNRIPTNHRNLTNVMERCLNRPALPALDPPLTVLMTCQKLRRHKIESKSESRLPVTAERTKPQA